MSCTIAVDFWRQAFLCRICRFELRIEAHESWPLLQVVGTTQVETPETGEIQNPILLVQALVEAGSYHKAIKAL